MTQRLDENRLDRLANRLAAEVTDAVRGLEAVRRSRTLTDDEATATLGDLLDARGIRLNEALLHSLATPERP